MTREFSITNIQKGIHYQRTVLNAERWYFGHSLVIGKLGIGY